MTGEPGKTSRGNQGFTLTEILIAVFILSLGIVGVMSLFPVGMDATNRALNNQLVYLASQTAFAQANYMINTSEVFDYRLRRPCYRVSSIHQPAATFSSVSSEIYIDVIRPSLWGDETASRSTWQPPVMDTPSRIGYCLTVIAGTGAGQSRKITEVSAVSSGVPTSYQKITVKPPFKGPPPTTNDSKLAVIKLDATSVFTITRWAMPPTPGSVRGGLVVSAGGGAINAKDFSNSLTSSVPVTWGANEFNPTVGAVSNADARFYVVLTSGMARGKVVPVTGQSGAQISVNPGEFSPMEPDENWLSSRVRPNDAFMVLGTKEVDAVFPFGPNPGAADNPSPFGQGAYMLDQTIPYGAAKLSPRGIPGGPYSYVLIMSNIESVSRSGAAWWQLPIPIPRDAFMPGAAAAGREISSCIPGARLDALVFLNYDYGRAIQNQSPSALVGTATTTITSLF